MPHTTLTQDCHHCGQPLATPALPTQPRTPVACEHCGAQNQSVGLLRIVGWQSWQTW